MVFCLARMELQRVQIQLQTEPSKVSLKFSSWSWTIKIYGRYHYSNLFLIVYL